MLPFWQNALHVPAEDVLVYSLEFFEEIIEISRRVLFVSCSSAWRCFLYASSFKACNTLAFYGRSFNKFVTLHANIVEISSPDLVAQEIFCVKFQV